MFKRKASQIKVKSKNSNIALIVIGLTFAATGGYFIVNSFAATGANIPACTTTVSSTSAAQTALNSASGGAVVCLSNGTYGKLTLSATKTSPGVTVRAENPGQATIDGASLSGAWYTLAQFNVTDEVKVENNAHHITVLHNSIGGGYMGITAGPGTYNNQRVKDITIRGNKIVGPLGEDGIRANQYDDGDGDGNGLLVEGNEFTKIIENGNHSDCLQTVWLGDDLVFKYNYLHDNRCQGFFVKDHGTLNTAYGDIGVINNIKVENNLFTRNNEPCAPQDPNCGQPSYFQVISPVNNFTMDKNTIWGGDLNTTLRNMDSDTTKSYNQWGPISVTNNVINRIWSDFPSIFGSNYSASNNIRGNTYNGSWPTTGFTTNDNPGFPAPTLAGGDDFRLNNGKGVTWKPSDCIFGPSATLATDCPWETSTAAPPAGPTANVWVDGNGGSCTWSSTPVAYADATACATFDAAWDKTSAGNTVRVKTGTYPAQLVSGDKASETKIIGENGTVVAGGMECEAVFGGSGAFCANARYMTLENVTIDSQNRAGKSSGSMINSPNVTFRDVDLIGDFVNLNIDSGADNFLWQRGSHGQDGIDGTPRGCDKSHGEPVWVFAANATLDGIRFNPKKILAGTPGQYCGTDNTPHLETIRTESGANNLTIKNSWFTPGSDAGSGHIFTSTGAPGLKLINNVFDPVNGSYSVQAGSSACDWTLLYNTFRQNLSLGCTSSFTTVGNLGVSNPSCSGTHFKNVWQGTNNGTACSGTDKTFSNLGIGTAGHLDSTSPAINAGEAGVGNDYCIGALVGAKDYEGGTRPTGGACDAGAHEYGSSTTPPPTKKPGDANNDNAVNITDLSILLSHWNATNFPSADFNNDNAVNIVDLSILLSNYGT